MKLTISLLLALLMVVSCASLKHNDDLLYARYMSYIERANAENLKGLAEDYFHPSTLRKNDLGDKDDMGLFLSQYQVKKIHSHYERIEGNKGCLTVNGSSVRGSPMSISLLYNNEAGTWLIVRIYVSFFERADGFTHRATCPKELSDRAFKKFHEIGKEIFNEAVENRNEKISPCSIVCSPARHNDNRLYARYMDYIKKISEAKIKKLSVNYFSSWLLKSFNLDDEYSRSRLLSGSKMEKIHSHYEVHDETKGCLTLNGFDANEEPKILSLSYKKISGIWLIDYIYPELIGSADRFAAQALCSGSAIWKVGD